jgi:hypothetical protein
MRPFLFFIVLSVAFACQHRQEGSSKPTIKELAYTEADAKKFFEDSIAGPDHKEFTSEKFPRFLKRYYPQLKTKTRNALIYALEEPFVDTTRIDTSKQWFRVTVDPCFRKPYSMIVEKSSGKSSLTIKVTNGFGCQYPGVLASTTKFKFVGELYDTVATKLETLNFWALGDDTTCHGGLDGERWLIEALDKGKYNVVYRWVPQSCGDSTTRNLANIVRRLATESRLDAILSAIGAPKSGL